MNVNPDKKWEWSNVTNSDFTPLFLIFLSLQQRQRRREEVKEEEDNCRALKATTPGNCDRQLWQNKNGQVYSHGIIVLPNGSSRALLRRTWTPFRSFFSREEKLKKIFSFFLTRFFPRPFWRGRNKRLQHQRHTKAKEYDKPAICLVRLFCASWWSVMVYNVVFVCLVIVVVPPLLCSGYCKPCSISKERLMTRSWNVTSLCTNLRKTVH